MNIYKYLAPLDNFEMHSAEFVLSDNIKIRKIDNDELKAFKYLSERWQNIKYDKFLIEVLLKREETENEPNQFLPVAREDIEMVIAILRLFKEQIVGYNFIAQPYSEKPYSLSAAHIRHYEHWISTNIKKFTKKYVLTITVENNIINFISKVDKKSFKKYELAIHFFNKSYIEPYTPRDSLVDLIVTLENLFLDGANQELGYKLRTRMAILLEKDFNKRKVIFDDINEAYKLRSKIVHGSKPKNLDYKFMFKIRNYARQSLKLFLKYSDLQTQLDNLVLGQSKKIYISKS